MRCATIRAPATFRCRRGRRMSGRSSPPGLTPQIVDLVRGGGPGPYRQPGVSCQPPGSLSTNDSTGSERGRQRDLLGPTGRRCGCWAPSLLRFSSPPGLAGPAAHETLLLCGCVVGTKVGILLVRLSPSFSWTRGSLSTSDCRHGPSSALGIYRHRRRHLPYRGPLRFSSPPIENERLALRQSEKSTRKPRADAVRNRERGARRHQSSQK